MVFRIIDRDLGRIGKERPLLLFFCPVLQVVLDRIDAAQVTAEAEGDGIQRLFCAEPIQQ